MSSCACNFGTGFAVSHCSLCCETFSSTTAFDAHIRQPDSAMSFSFHLAPGIERKSNGDPVFMKIRQTPDGQPVWGLYATDEQWAKLAEFRSEQ